MTLRREPAAVGAFVLAVIAAAGAVLNWSSEQTGLVSACAGAAVAAYVAWQTVDTWASALINLVGAALAVAVGFGAPLSDDATALVIGVVTAGLALFNRTQTSPTISARERAEALAGLRGAVGDTRLNR